MSIPFSKPSLTEREAQATHDVITSGRLILGPEVRAFEAALAAFTERRHAIAVTSGTSALQLGLQAMGVDHTYSVIVPAYTWVATWNVAHWLGAEPILMDVDPNTYCLDPHDLERALSACTRPHRAILPVHMFGYRVDPDWLEATVDAHELLLLGDGCCAFGGEHRGKRCGAWTPIECLSFHPRKVITTGEGGAILLDDDALADRLTRLRDHGAIRSRSQRDQTTAGGLMTPEFPEPGHNLRMTEMQGALGRVQMARVEELIAARRRVASTYDALLSRRAPWLSLPPGGEDPGRVLTFYPVQLGFKGGTAHREVLVEALKKEGIASRPPMIHLLDQPFTQDSRRGHDFPGTRYLADHTLALPFFPDLSDAQIERVVSVIERHPPHTTRKE